MSKDHLADALRRLLELLAADAGGEEFQQPALDARTCGVAAPVVAGIESATALAVQVQQRLLQHRRREVELAALFETAGDLASLRDLDAVLQSIVRRARRLLGTDTAYLTLPDEEAGDTYVRVTDGSVSPLFQSLRVPLGTGLGGLVAQTARPYASADYRNDERFRRSSVIDAGIVDEGLVAILGVPLVLGSSTNAGGKVVGVLFAADRAVRQFLPDEVALLCSLAAHAAIAIDTARALDDTRTALGELAEANAVIGAHAAALQRAEQAHDRLTDLILRGGAMADVAAAAAELLGGPIAVHDPAGHPLAQVPAITGTPHLDAAGVVTAVAESRAAGRAVLLGDRWVCTVLAGPELLGALVLSDRSQLPDPDRRLFERASVVTALLMLLRRSVAETENRIRGELLTDLLSGVHRDPDGLVDRGRRLGIDLTRPHLLLAADAPEEARVRLATAAAKHLFGTGGTSAEHAGAMVLLMPTGGTGSGQAAREAAEHLNQLVGAPVTVAAVGPAKGPAALVAAHTEAIRCLRALHILGRTGDGACAQDLGFLGVLLGDSHDVDAFATATLGPLLAYDARRGTELVGTLRAYFASGSNLTRAKDNLHIHVNTLVQRLERIESFLGPDWNTPDGALELQLALRLRQLSEHQAGRRHSAR